jgi:PAS domain-containing protein
VSPAHRTDAPVVDFEVIEQPDLPLIEELVAYWERKRGMRLAPCRADVDLMDLRMHLRTIFMVDVLDGGADFRYRLIGTAIVAGLGRDSTGKRLSELYHDRPKVLARLLERFNLVLTQKRPVFTRGQVYRLPDATIRRFVSGAVPLSDDGATVNIVLVEMLLAWS